MKVSLQMVPEKLNDAGIHGDERDPVDRHGSSTLAIDVIDSQADKCALEQVGPIQITR